LWWRNLRSTPKTDIYMAKAATVATPAEEMILSKIYMIRGRKVMPDYDLAEMCVVETKQLKRQVRRNLARFPGDFMFELTSEEYEALRSQIGTLKRGEHSKYVPMAFTEQGVAMLSSVLNSPTAIQVNIQIIRVFTRIRELMLTQKDIFVKLEQIEKELLKQNWRLDKHEEEIQIIFNALKELLNPPQEPRPRIGFRRLGEVGE
jgi:ORF6N domain